MTCHKTAAFAVLVEYLAILYEGISRRFKKINIFPKYRRIARHATHDISFSPRFPQPAIDINVIRLPSMVNGQSIKLSIKNVTNFNNVSVQKWAKKMSFN